MSDDATIGSAIDQELGYDTYTLILTGAGYEQNKNEVEFDQLAESLDEAASVDEAHKYTLHEYERADLEQQDIFSYDFDDESVLCIPGAYRSRQPRNHEPIERYATYLDELEDDDGPEAVLFMDLDEDMAAIDHEGYTREALIAEMKRRWDLNAVLDITWTSHDTDLLMAGSDRL